MKRQQMYKTEEGRAILKFQEGKTHHGGCGNCGGGCANNDCGGGCGCGNNCGGCGC